MFRNCGTADRKISRDVADRLASVAQDAENVAPGWICKGSKYCVAFFAGYGNHSVTNKRNQLVSYLSRRVLCGVSGDLAVKLYGNYVLSIQMPHVSGPISSSGRARPAALRASLIWP